MGTALVVEDYEDIATMLAVILEHAGWHTTIALSADSALAAAESAHFDVIVSDIGLPKMNGYELMRRLRQMPGCRRAVAVAVTGFACYDDRQRALAAGFDDHFMKAVNPSTLVKRIESLCTSKQQKSKRQRR